MSKLPSISIVIPTFNSGRVLRGCLNSISSQDYPAEKIELILVDAGSSDDTLKIAKQYKIDQVLKNPLKTGEAGKAVGIKASKNEIIALIDSDNYLESKDWLKKMVKPFEDPEIVSSEPLYWTYNKNDSIVNRYAALTGINDPICLFLGNYDRYSFLTQKWTEFLVSEEIDKGDYLKVTLDKRFVPTMGANGYLVRRELLREVNYEPYYFDIDVVYQLVQKGYRCVARPKIGIIHIFCNEISDFKRKQRRRINDYFFFKHQGLRTYKYNIASFGYFKYLVFTLLIVPLIFQSLKGYIRKPDYAWFFHPIACWITLWEYGLGTIKGQLQPVVHDRKGWKQ